MSKLLSNARTLFVLTLFALRLLLVALPPTTAGFAQWPPIASQQVSQERHPLPPDNACPTPRLQYSSSSSSSPRRSPPTRGVLSGLPHILQLFKPSSRKFHKQRVRVLAAKDAEQVRLLPTAGCCKRGGPRDDARQDLALSQRDLILFSRAGRQRGHRGAPPWNARLWEDRRRLVGHEADEVYRPLYSFTFGAQSPL